MLRSPPLPATSQLSRCTSTSIRNEFILPSVALIKSALSFDLSGMLAQGQNAMVGLGVYVVPFVIGLILSLTMWTCLCCCCTCPGCCPSKCCQHDENTLYTKCEMMWPVLFLMIVLLLACAAAVPGMLFISTQVSPEPRPWLTASRPWNAESHWLLTI